MDRLFIVTIMIDTFAQTWRAELAPKDSETITTTILNSGFTPVGMGFEVIVLAFAMFIGVALLLGFVTMDIGHLKKEVKAEFSSLVNQVDSIYSLVYDLSDEPGSKKRKKDGPKEEEKVTVAGGPGGILDESHLKERKHGLPKLKNTMFSTIFI
jgi:hypothetical protein